MGTGAGICIVNTSQMTPPRHIPFLLVLQSCRQGEAAEGLGAAGPGTVVGPAQGLLVTVPIAQAVAPEAGLATVGPEAAGVSAITAARRLGPFPGTGGGGWPCPPAGPS